MEIEEAVKADGLWGWPVDVLDNLSRLRADAYGGTISLDEWREQDLAIRAGSDAVPREEVESFQTEVMMDFSKAISDDARDQLMKRLASLTMPPPTDEDLWDSLALTQQLLDEHNRDEVMVRALRERRHRIVGWITRPGGGVDVVTGLPWTQVLARRVVQDPVIGPVPQFLESGRALALEQASKQDLDRARLLNAGRDRSLAGIARLTGEMTQNQLTWVPTMVAKAAEQDDRLEPILTDLRRLWSDERVQDVLMRETAEGWPPEAD